MNEAMRGAWAAGDIPLLWALSLRIARAYWRQRLRADGVVMAEAESKFGLIFTERIGQFPGFRTPEAVVKSWARSTGLNARRGELRRKRWEAEAAVDLYDLM